MIGSGPKGRRLSREGILSAERVERRLAAIPAADIAGYSRLMGQDEPGTFARIKARRRELIDPKIAEHKGRIFKTDRRRDPDRVPQRRRGGRVRGCGAAGDAGAQR
jgi:class 3 adenylate cyclase